MSSLPPPPLLSALWRSPCLYTMNTLASTLQNQLSRWEEGKSNLTAATRRGDCFSSRWQRGEHIVPLPQVYWGNKEPNGLGGGLQLPGCECPVGPVSPCLPHPPKTSSPSPFPLTSPLILTPLPSPSDSGDFIPPSTLPDETEQ